MSMVVLGALVSLMAPATQPAKPVPKDQNLMGQQAVWKRGAEFTLKESVSLDDVAKAPEKYAGKVVKVSGKVAAVCKKKGCWMTIAGTTARARVSFKDYAFFAPFDAADAMGTVEGTVEVKKLSDAERAHLAEDAGKKVDEIPAVELRLMASALEIKRVGH